MIGDFFPYDKTDTKFLTSFSELIEDVHGEGQGKWKYGIKILRGDMETTTLVEKITRLIDSGKMLEEIPIRL